MGFIDRLRGIADGNGPERRGTSEGRSRDERRLVARLLSLCGGADETRMRVHLRFTGTVQGVGFRWTNQGIAREAGETGWVKNLDDGSVEMEIQGTPGTIMAHLRDLHGYYDRMGCRVWLVTVEELPIREQDADFDVRF